MRNNVVGDDNSAFSHAQRVEEADVVFFFAVDECEVEFGLDRNHGVSVAQNEIDTFGKAEPGDRLPGVGLTHGVSLDRDDTSTGQSGGGSQSDGRDAARASNLQDPFGLD